MSTPHGTDPDDELLRAVLEGEEPPRPPQAPRVRRDPISPTARERLASGQATPPAPEERPTVDEVYGEVHRGRGRPRGADTASGPSRPARPAASPAAPTSAAPVAPDAGSASPAVPTTRSTPGAFIGVDAESPEQVREAVRPSVPSADVPRVPPSAERPVRVQGAPEQHEPGQHEPGQRESENHEPEQHEPEQRDPAGPAADAGSALAAGLQRSAPDTAQIRQVEAESPWRRLQAPGLGEDAPALSIPRLGPVAETRPAASGAGESAPRKEPAPVVSESRAPSASVRPDERRGFPRGALIAAVALLIVLAVVLLIALQS